MDEFTQCQRLFQEIGQKLNWFKQRPQDVLVNVCFNDNSNFLFDKKELLKFQFVI